MGWNNPTRRWIDGHFSVWRGMLLDDPYRAPFARRAGSTGPISVRLFADTPAASEAFSAIGARQASARSLPHEVPKDGLQLVAQPAARSPADRSREKQRMISARRHEQQQHVFCCIPFGLAALLVFRFVRLALDKPETV